MVPLVGASRANPAQVNLVTVRSRIAIIEEIEDKAHQIIEQSPGAVVEFRLLRDVLRQSPDDIQLREARK